jgi:hypothetical protein
MPHDLKILVPPAQRKLKKLIVSAVYNLTGELAIRQDNFYKI